MEKVFVQVCNSQECGMIIAKTILLLTKKVVFDEITIRLSGNYIPAENFVLVSAELRQNFRTERWTTKVKSATTSSLHSIRIG